MENKAKHIGQVSILFGAGLASHCLGSTPENTAIIASSLGLSIHVAQGIFTLGSHILSHGVYESLIKAKEIFRGDMNYDLETAILNAYRESLSQIEKDIIDEYKVKEKLSGKLMRYVFNKTNKEYDELFDLKESFLFPLFEALTSDKVIEEMVEQNMQLNPDEFLRKLIEKSIPEFTERDNDLFVDFINKVCEKFKHYFKHYFLQELKREEKARTVYFTHLLEGIILNTKNISSDLPIIRDFAAQADLKLPEILNSVKEGNENVLQMMKEIEHYQNQIIKKLESIRKKIRNYTAPALDKRNSKDDLNPNKDSNKFDFKYRYLDFVGRNDEMSRLWRFVGTKGDEQKFLWWIIIGPGGMGKSRIAQNLCLMDDEYYAGFFDFKSISQNPNWDYWEPEMPTIIIIDYALSKIEKVVELIITLKQRCKSFFYPVRLLLLDREETDEWRQKIHSNSLISDSIYVEEGKREGSTLELLPLDIESRWNIVKQVVLKEGKIKWEVIEKLKNEIVKKMNELDEKHRPLFTFFMAMALAKGSSIRDWDITELLDYTLAKIEDLWVKYIKNAKLSEKYRYIIFINTYCGTLDKKEIADLLKTLDVDISFSDFRNAYSLIGNHTKTNDIEFWEGIQPDFLAEYFIKKTIEKILDENPLDGEELISNLIKKSFRLNPENVARLSLLINIDFKGELKKYDLFENLYKHASEFGDEKMKKEMSWAFLERGTFKLISDQIEEAILDYDKAIELDPKSYFAFCNRGNAKTFIHKYDDAISDYDFAINLDRKSFWAYCHRGAVKVNLRKGKEAFSDFALAYKISENSITKYHLALGKSVLGRFNEAVKDLSVLIEVNPGNYEYYFNRGSCFISLGKYVDALQDLERAISLKPDYADAYSEMAAAKGHLSLFDDAMKYFEKAIELDPDNSVFYNNRGFALRENGKIEKSIEDFEKAIKLDPTNGHAYYNKSISEKALGRFNEAIESVKKEVEINKEIYDDACRSDSLIFIGEIYYENLKDYNKAIEYLIAAIAIDNQMEMYSTKCFNILSSIRKSVKVSSDQYKLMVTNAINNLPEIYKNDFPTKEILPNTPIKSEKKYNRNDHVSVIYDDGRRKIDVKFKTVEEDIKSGKCVVIVN